MDWINLLESQQTDFIQRLKSGHLLHCDIEGQHSELTVISGDRLTQLRKFCWQMADKYKRNSPVQQVFLNNLKGKLAEEVVKARIENQTLDDYFVEHTGDIYSVVISTNWILASGGQDGKVKVCNLRKKELIHDLDKHTKAVNSIAISSDSKTIASGSDDKTIKIWDINTGELIRTLSGHLHSVQSVATSSDNYILVSSSCESVKIWDLKTGQLLHTLNENSSMVRCIAISPDGKIVASAGEDNTIKLWYAKTGELLHTLIGHSHQEGIDSIAFSPNGQMLASGNGDNTVEIWRRG